MVQVHPGPPDFSINYGQWISYRSPTVPIFASGPETGFAIASMAARQRLTLVVEGQLYTAGALVSFDAYTVGKLPDHKGR